MPPLSPREFCALLFQKPLEMMTNQNLSTDQMFGGFLGANHLNFEGLWVISEKMSCRLISRGKKHANKFLREKYPALKKISIMTRV